MLIDNNNNIVSDPQMQFTLDKAMIGKEAVIKETKQRNSKKRVASNLSLPLNLPLPNFPFPINFRGGLGNNNESITSKLIQKIKFSNVNVNRKLHKSLSKPSLSSASANEVIISGKGIGNGNGNGNGNSKGVCPILFHSIFKYGNESNSNLKLSPYQLWLRKQRYSNHNSSLNNSSLVQNKYISIRRELNFNEKEKRDLLNNSLPPIPKRVVKSIKIHFENKELLNKL